MEQNKINLTNRTEIPVRFSEIDVLGILWHGHNVKFFEDGREAFSKQFGLGYLDIIKHKLTIPLIEINVEFKRIVKYGDAVIVDTTFVNAAAAKIIFDYKIHRMSDGALTAQGRTTQVFMDLNHELYPTMPAFFEDWKRKYGIQ